MNLGVHSVAWLVTLVKLRGLPGHRRIAQSAVVRGDVTIGDYTYIGAFTEIRGTLTSVVIGRYCSIGRAVKIFSRGQVHSFHGLSTYPFFVLDKALDRRHFNVPVGPTVIGNDVWIGSNAVVMAGVTIGDGAAVGAGAIVTKDVPPYTIVAGSPARAIRTRFSESIGSRVQSSRWWDLDYDELRSKYPELIVENQPLEEGTAL